MVIRMSNNEILNMYFGIIEDPRCEANVVHPLIDILKLVMLAVLCGMDELDKIIDYGENKKEFLEKEFNIKKIPSKSILTRVMTMISPNTYKRKCKSNNVGWKSHKINRNNKYNRNNDEHSNSIYRYGNIIRTKNSR